jgi:hypothetical protein
MLDINAIYGKGLAQRVLALVPEPVKVALALAGIPEDKWWVIGGAVLDVADGRPARDIDIVFESPPSLEKDREALVRTALLAQGLTVGSNAHNSVRIPGPPLEIDLWATARADFMRTRPIEVTGTSVRGDGVFWAAKGFFNRTSRVFVNRFTVAPGSPYTAQGTAEYYVAKYKDKGYHLTIVEG